MAFPSLSQVMPLACRVYDSDRELVALHSSLEPGPSGPALKVAIDDECSGKGLVFTTCLPWFTKNNPPDFGLLFLAQFARFSIRTEAAFTRIRIDPDIRMSQLRIGLPSTRKRLKCTLSGAIRYAIRSCSKTISKVDHPDVPVLFGDV